ncbi:hypothetical protein ACOME3_002553 [Neoechinorhynchus agilis]
MERRGQFSIRGRRQERNRALAALRIREAPIQDSLIEEGEMMYNFTVEMDRLNAETCEEKFARLMDPLTETLNTFTKTFEPFITNTFDDMLYAIDSSIDQIRSLDKYGAKLQVGREIFGKFTNFVVQHRQMHKNVSAFKKSVSRITVPFKFRGHCVPRLIESDEERCGVENLIGLGLFRMAEIEAARIFVNESVDIGRCPRIDSFSQLLRQFDSWEWVMDRLSHFDTDAILERFKDLHGNGDCANMYIPQCLQNFLKGIDQMHFISLCRRNQHNAALDYLRESSSPELRQSPQISKLMRKLFQTSLVDDEDMEKCIETFQRDFACVLCIMDPRSNENAARCFNALTVCLHAGRQICDTVTKVGKVAREQSEVNNLDLKTYCERVFNSAVKLHQEPFLYHSYFLCPVLRKPDTPRNPPVRLSCGHIVSLSASTTGTRGRTVHQGGHLLCVYCQKQIDTRNSRPIAF